MPLQSIAVPQALPALLGAVTYPTAASPVGATLYVSSLTGRGDGHGRLIPMGSSSPSVTQGNNQGSLTDPSNPLKSVFGPAGALTLCKAGRGDIILVLPGHTENLTNNSTYTIPDGVTILGFGYGAARPTFVFTGGASTNITFGGSGQIQNCIFDFTGVAGVTVGMTITTGGVQLASCRFILASATNHCTSGFSLAGSDFVLYSCDVDATGASTGVAQGILVGGAGSTRAEIISNVFHGNFSSGCISGTAQPLIEAVVQYNDFRQTNGTANTASINLGALTTHTGVWAYNNFFVQNTPTGGTNVVVTSSTSIAWIQNFGQDNAAANKSGVLIPTVITFP